MAYTTYLTILIPAIFAFVITFVSTKFLISYMREAGITAEDRNKKPEIDVPGSGGVAVAFGFAFGLLVYVFGSSFNLYYAAASIIPIFACILSVILIALVGFIDDINVKAERVKATDLMDKKKGLKQWQKPLLTFVGAIPLVAVNAGISTLVLPFVGPVQFGIIYPLVILPLAIVFAANAVNLLGGFDGLSTGTTFIATLALLIYSIVYGTYTGALISGVLAATLFAFLIFTLYPAKIRDGDSFQYAMGAALVSAMALGNMEAFGFIVFLPWTIEFVLHARRKFQVTDLGKRRSDGTFAPPYGKRIYSWTHFIMNVRRNREWEVSIFMWLVEIAFVLFAFGLKIFRFL